MSFEPLLIPEEGTLMKIWIRRAARGVGIFAVAGGVALAAANPASAASPNRASALQFTGVIPGEPFVVSTYPGDTPNQAGSLNLPSLLTTGVIDTAASPTAAGATVNNLTLAL